MTSRTYHKYRDLRRRLMSANMVLLLALFLSTTIIRTSSAATFGPLVGPDTNNTQRAYLDVATAKAQGVTYQLLKSTEGTGFIDGYFAQGRANAVAAGLVVGAYHFLDRGAGAAQCDAYLAELNATGGINNIILAIDVELQNPTVGPSYQDVLDFLNHCEALTPGRTWLLYTAPWYWGAAHTGGYLGNPPAPAHTVLWVSLYVNGSGNAFSLLNGVAAQGTPGDPYTSNPINGWPDYAMRQYTSTGTIANLTGDTNVTYKGLDYLKQLAGMQTAPAVPVKVGIASTPSGAGYWEVASDGGVFTYGDGVFYGSMGATSLNAPISGMAATPDGKGYWLVGQDGGLFAFGDAAFYGPTTALNPSAPIVGMAATPDGKGYWLAGADGGIFNYGDAGFYGSAGATHLADPIVGMAATPDGKGYWLVGSDGGIFGYGDANFYGSTASLTLSAPIVGMAATPDGKGYWLAGADGGIFNYGDAGFYGSKGGGSGYVGVTATGVLGGYRLVNRDATAPAFEPPPVTPPPPPPPPDTTPPVVAFVQPLNGDPVAGSVAISDTASDNVGIAKVEFYVDGQLLGANTAPPYAFTLNTSSLTAGAHTLTLKAYDAAGNVGVATETVNVNNTPTLVPGDFNNDQIVDIRDFNILIIHWGQTVTANTNGDLDTNGTVDIRDLNQFLIDWGTFLSNHPNG